jgi:two-component sensor histidine kinase
VVTGEPPALVLAPLAGDAAALARLVNEAGATAELCGTIAALETALRDAPPERALFVVVAEEAADARCGTALEAYLAAEPSWARLPVVFLVNNAEALPPAPRRLEQALADPQITLLQRPASPAVLKRIFTRQAEGRRRQYATRDLLARLEAAERRQALLLGELRHRIRNTLAVLRALFTLTARSQDDLESLTRVFGERLDALARAHARLGRDDTPNADLEELIRDHVVAYAYEPAQLRCQGPAVSLTSRAAFNLALVIHELATNAAKYGALSAAAGRVDATWDIEHEDGGIDLRWVERGGPPVEATPTSGLGMQLVTRIGLEEGASADLVFAREGVVWRCTLPASSRADRRPTGGEGWTGTAAR